MTLAFPPTPHQWLRAAQLLSCAAAAIVTVALGQRRGKSKVLRVAVPVAAFFLAACLTRFLLEETLSRLQMAAFVVAALFLERLRARSSEESFAWWRWASNAAAAVAGVLLAKHVLEPGSISSFVERVVDTSLDWVGV